MVLPIVQNTVSGPFMTDGMSSLGAFELGQNFQRINFLLQRLFVAVSRREVRNPGVEGPGQPLFLRAAVNQAQGWATNPMKAFNTHIQFWQNTTALYAELTQAMLSGGAHVPKEDEQEKDARFADAEWSKHPFFYYLKRQYQIMSAYLDSLADSASTGDDEKHAEQIHFFTHQLVDLFSPSNFLASNPVAIKTGTQTGTGQLAYTQVGNNMGLYAADQHYAIEAAIPIPGPRCPRRPSNFHAAPKASSVSPPRQSPSVVALIVPLPRSLVGQGRTD